MATRIEIQKSDGSKDVYESTPLSGYHIRETDRGPCVVKREFNAIPDMISKRELTKETPVRCYSGSPVSSTQERCDVCAKVNPTQRETPPPPPPRT